MILLPQSSLVQRANDTSSTILVKSQKSTVAFLEKVELATGSVVRWFVDTYIHMYVHKADLHAHTIRYIVSKNNNKYMLVTLFRILQYDSVQ
jgi:hypothetical protein